jgi:ATP-binding cassette subfamily F protein 3
MLYLNNISCFLNGVPILENVNLQLADGHKGGLIGRNGCGKSTLFKIILGELEPDSGEVEMSRGMKIVTVAQEVPGGEQTPLEFLLNSDKERKQLFEELENNPDPNRLADIYDRLIQINAYSAEGRAAVILKGLGFNEEKQNMSLSSFSGGFRMRVALAAALFQTPDLLLLDEPTNHLDLESIIWLQDFLKSYPNSLLVVSHERDFLNVVTDHIFHLQRGKLTTYKGNYDVYEEKHRLKLEADVAYNKRIEAQRSHMQKFVDRFRYKATKAKQAQSRIKAIEKLNPVTLVLDDPTIKISFPEPEQLPSPIVSFEKVVLGYDDTPILRNLTGSILCDDRIALLGANGNGKSTFAKFVAKRLKPMAGNSRVLDKLRIGYFHQHQFEELKLEATPFDHIQELLPGSNPQQIRTHLGNFGFSGDKALSKVKQLSGGEKARLVFSMITTLKPNILILDEPTNHLDMDMRESLIFAINAFDGAVILITHDWHLLSHTADRIWVVENKTIQPYEGSIYDYKEQVLSKIGY